MREILQDTTWQAIGAIFTVAAILVSVLIYRLQRQRRALTYTIKSTYLLMRDAGELHGRVVVHVDGVPVANVGILFLEIQNSGNTSIARADFDMPVSIRFTGDSVVISANIVSEEPANLGAVIEEKDTAMQLQPLLMNPGDKVTIKFLVAGNSLDLDIGGRIVGIKSIRAASPTEGFAWRAVVAMILMAAGITLAAFNVPTLPDPPPKPPAVLWGIGVFIFGYFFLTFALLRGKMLLIIMRRLAKLLNSATKKNS